MICRCLLLIGVAMIFQVAHGGWIQRQAEYYLSPLLHPIASATEELQGTINKFQAKKQELEDQKKELKNKIDQIPEKCQTEELHKSFGIFDKWNFDSCVNFTDDMKFGSDLVIQYAEITRNISEITEKLGSNILDCTNSKYSDIFPCYNKNLKDLKATAEVFKVETVPIVNNSVIVARNMRVDFDHCVGIPITLRNNVENEIEKIKC